MAVFCSEGAAPPVYVKLDMKEKDSLEGVEAADVEDAGTEGAVGKDAGGGGCA